MKAPKENELERKVHELNMHHACVMMGGKFVVVSETLNPATGMDDVAFSAVNDIKKFVSQ